MRLWQDLAQSVVMVPWCRLSNTCCPFCIGKFSACEIAWRISYSYWYLLPAWESYWYTRGTQCSSVRSSAGCRCHGAGIVAWWAHMIPALCAALYVNLISQLDDALGAQHHSCRYAFHKNIRTNISVVNMYNIIYTCYTNEWMCSTAGHLHDAI